MSADGFSDNQIGALEGTEVMGDGAGAELEVPGDLACGLRLLEAAQDLGSRCPEQRFERRRVGRLAPAGAGEAMDAAAAGSRGS